ncbi:HNH endonuclease domain-containing protein [Chamaesiphon sp. OTE_8_metabat_110]|uniref:HNH endonuclease domain-containing protein n=1 Tax=Chamaesiphon sp. OTE_8_metabat_110 TaxID=2964696 RepID=UPI00286D3892|nr:HNH endonuclease domain-containing protein [Chamaesiphon sp. OTE_8_metabat_110]
MGKLNFISQEPTLSEYWRSVILFGKNSASYKFALAKSLLEIAPTGKAFVTLDDLAQPFARHLCEHLKLQDKQTNSPTCKFLDTCRGFNAGTVGEDELLGMTVNEGFKEVIKAFHNVNQSELPQRFFTDERKSQRRGIALTDELFKLFESGEFTNLDLEVEARWRLVETAWGVGISQNLLRIKVDDDKQILFVPIDKVRRIEITSSRGALNGYQKGKCFYCFDKISVAPEAEDLTDVDHFFPHKLRILNLNHFTDNVWNLVLACQKCNRGAGGKFAQLPSPKLRDRLYTRNEYLIDSHHPLRQTLIQQMGDNPVDRFEFIKAIYESARAPLGFSQWEPEERGIPSFSELEL